MSETQKKCRNSQMSTVVQQRQKTRVEPAKRPNTKNDGQQQECSATEGPDEQGLDGGVRMDHVADAEKYSKIESDTGDENRVVHTFLSIPTNSFVTDTHCGLPRTTESMMESAVGL